ncbi:hypothetical protein FDUTEX481_07417 [Tolypothrix sp. PCC 7601]|nr:hypothetical protein FDUTEX481_07417 [Tolypothrix sp. PCC 7601]
MFAILPHVPQIPLPHSGANFAVFHPGDETLPVPVQATLVNQGNYYR